MRKREKYNAEKERKRKKTYSEKCCLYTASGGGTEVKRKIMTKKYTNVYQGGNPIPLL